MISRWFSERIRAWVLDRRRWGACMAGVLLLGSGWIWFTAARVDPGQTGKVASPKQGFPAPEFRLELLQGGQVSLSELRGQVVVLNLWASWCPPCRAEMPDLQRLYEDEAGRGLVVLAVNSTFQDSQAAAARFVADHGLTFPVALDHSGEVSRIYQLRALPTTFFVDRRGVIRSIVIGGPMSPTTMRSAVEPLLSETP